MYAEERQAAIVARARATGRVEVAELADAFEVTPETVRRDLTSLERAGLLRRVHGGAIVVDLFGFEPALAVREAAHQAEKARIAEAALHLVPDEGAIALDAGSSTQRLAELLPADRELTVVTNSLPIASLLAARPKLTVHLVGGRVRSRTQATVDQAALAFLRGIFVDVAFLGTNGFSVARGLTTPDPAEAAVKAALIASARQAVLLADHTKLGNDCFAHFGELADLAAIVTDAGLPDHAAAELEAAGPQVVRA
ncbi:MAG: DeoR/GlpR family DNA-binding transcription regulator [Candidatus Nanopelagicales bacterium]|jgi:DeoR family fructose operon transcriptional repressor|nr:DeoR/GlpR family DNA-binding transcription regulator [Candidatus Nanopelagicales bacterium]